MVFIYRTYCWFSSRTIYARKRLWYSWQHGHRHHWILLRRIFFFFSKYPNHRHHWWNYYRNGRSCRLSGGLEFPFPLRSETKRRFMLAPPQILFINIHGHYYVRTLERKSKQIYFQSIIYIENKKCFLWIKGSIFYFSFSILRQWKKNTIKEKRSIKVLFNKSWYV